MILPKDNGTDVFEVLRFPASLEHLSISGYPGVSLPTWFHPHNFPKLTTLCFENCDGLGTSALSFSRVSQNINLNETLDSNDPINGTFSSLRELTLSGCGNIVSLNDFLDPASVPAIKKIIINDCKSLVSVPTGCLGDLHCLEELEVFNCPNIHSPHLVAPSHKRLIVCGNSGILANNIERFLAYFKFSNDCDTIKLSVPAVEELRISECRSLTSIGTVGIGAFTSLISLTVSGCAKLSTLDDFLTAEHLPAVKEILIETCPELLSLPSGAGAFSSLISLTVHRCAKLSTLDDFLTAEHLPAVENITISRCPELLSLPSERYGSFHSLKTFEVGCCPSMNWQRGLVLPLSLQKLSFDGCGDISTVIPSCLQNLEFLLSLMIGDCPGITSIPGNVWQSYLPSLKELTIDCCPNLESIGGSEAIAKIEYVKVTFCPKLGYFLS